MTSHSPLRFQRGSLTTAPVLTPETKKKIDYLKAKYRGGSEDVRRQIQLEINQGMRRHQESPTLLPKATSTVLVINQDAFANFGPGGHMKKECWGKNWEEYHRSIGDTSYDPVRGPIKASTHAVRKIVDEILNIGDDDHIALTLMMAQP